MQAFGACLHSTGLRDGPSWGWGILPRMSMCRELSKANGGAVWKTVAASRYLFLFITEDRRRHRCPAWGLREQYGDQRCLCFTSGVISQTLMSLKLWGRGLSLDPVGWEVSCSWPQSHPFTDLSASLLGAESPNQVFSLISPYSCGPGLICQASVLPSLPSFFLLTLGSAQAHHSCCWEGSGFCIQGSSSDLQASRQDHLPQAQTPPLQPPWP